MPASACSTSQSTVIVRSPSVRRSVTARSERPISRWISWVRPPGRPLLTSRGDPLDRGAREHRVLAGDPALARCPSASAAASSETRRGAQHARLAHREQHGARRPLLDSRAHTRPGGARRRRGRRGASRADLDDRRRCAAEVDGPSEHLDASSRDTAGSRSGDVGEHQPLRARPRRVLARLRRAESGTAAGSSASWYVASAQEQVGVAGELDRPRRTGPVSPVYASTAPPASIRYPSGAHADVRHLERRDRGTGRARRRLTVLGVVRTSKASAMTFVPSSATSSAARSKNPSGE